jgi:hypothetical protein
LIFALKPPEKSKYLTQNIAYSAGTIKNDEQLEQNLNLKVEFLIYTFNKNQYKKDMLSSLYHGTFAEF